MQLNIETTDNKIKKNGWKIKINRNFYKGNIQMTKTQKQKKRCLTSVIIRKRKSKLQ